MSRRLTIEEMRVVAANRGGVCLSNGYKNLHSKLTWRCREGHTWDATPASIRNGGKWCPFCAGNRRLTTNEMQQLAESRGGRCLSKTYINSKTKLQWECSRGHTWWAKPAEVKNQGTWCPICSGKQKLDLNAMVQLAAKKGGKCLSSSYRNNRTKLLWRCATGHEFTMTPTHVKAGHWCPICAGVGHLSIQNMHELAKSRGGKCRSKKYINNKTKILWECCEGHQWRAVPNSIMSGRWCPECSAGLGERICREFFEQLFSSEFPKSRPHWLRNQRGNLMELDGYSEELMIAFEHQGTQHYRELKVYGIGTDELVLRQCDDEEKKALCNAMGIKLLVIPEIPGLLPVEKLKPFIRVQCLKQNIRIPELFDQIEVKFDRVYRFPFSKSRFKELCEIARKWGGKCLSNGYLSTKTKMEWQCSEGHRWEAVPGTILKGLWCPHCSGIARGTLERCRETAEARGGACLSDVYINNRDPMQWRCSQGHIWKTSWHSIVNGHWCPECSKDRSDRKLTINEMRRIAEERGGECISDFYENSKSDLEWKCQKGHTWYASPSRIKRGSWCPYCAGVAKGSIEHCQELAMRREGRCLSTEYKGNKIKLIWECSEGHKWKARPNDISSGYWCPKCGLEAGASKQRLSIDEMMEIARLRGGRCLSASYINRRTKLRWECAEGHQWYASPANVKVRGSWCPVCAKRRRKI